MSQSLLILLIVIALIAISCATLRVPTYDGEKSDHFDGKKFFNPDGPGMGSFRDLMKYNKTHKKGVWEQQDTSISIQTPIQDFSKPG